MIPERDALALRWAGALGHTFVVLVTLEDGRRATALETCDKYSALFNARTENSERDPIVYQQVKASKWKRVRS